MMTSQSNETNGRQTMAIHNIVSTADVEVRNDEQAAEWVCVNVNKVSNRSSEYIAVDIRKYVESDNYDGFTKQGVSLSVEHAKELLVGLEAAIEAAEDAQKELEAKTETPKVKRTPPSKKTNSKTTNSKAATKKAATTKKATSVNKKKTAARRG